MKIGTVLGLCVIFGWNASSVAADSAASYPNKPIRILVGQSPGGASDIVARALAITATKRLAIAPELPTIAESGLLNYEFSSWFGMLAPAGTPPAIVAKLQTETAKALKQPDLSERLARDGSEPVGSTPAQFAAYLKTEMAKWADVIKRSGMQPE